MRLFGGIEAGGTKFVCGIGAGPEDIRTQEFPTTTPDETVARVAAFFANQCDRERMEVIGIASFGPIDLNSGCITSTPKLAWRHFDIADAIRKATGAEVRFDTDVNAAALAEHRWGAARGLDTFVYLTVGTGIGGGGMVNGSLMHGLVHPEMGHIRVPHDWSADPFKGNCPSHGDCLEGLAAGPALEARWGIRCVDLPADHAAWELESQYLALGIVNLICIVSPQRIVMGGGVMRHRELFPAIRTKVQKLLNDYIHVPEIDAMDRYIVAPELGGRAGVLGAIALAQNAKRRNSGADA